MKPKPRCHYPKIGTELTSWQLDPMSLNLGEVKVERIETIAPVRAEISTYHTRYNNPVSHRFFNQGQPAPSICKPQSAGVYSVIGEIPASNTNLTSESYKGDF
jgi:hypothetical protein